MTNKRFTAFPLEDHITIPLTVPGKRVLQELSSRHSLSLSGFVRSELIDAVRTKYPEYDMLYEKYANENEFVSDVITNTTNQE